MLTICDTICIASTAAITIVVVRNKVVITGRRAVRVHTVIQRVRGSVCGGLITVRAQRAVRRGIAVKRTSIVRVIIRGGGRREVIAHHVVQVSGWR